MAVRSLRELVLAPLNHVMRSEEWPLEKLRKHAGAEIRIESGALLFNIRLDEQGLFAADCVKEAPDVVLVLPADAPLRLIGDRENLFSSVRLSGAVEVAESLAFVLRHLRYDIESDLAPWIGDIAAHRLARAARALGEQVEQAVKRTGENFADYLTEDSELLPAKREIGNFVRDVDVLRDDVARLEKRLQRL